MASGLNNNNNVAAARVLSSAGIAYYSEQRRMSVEPRGTRSLSLSLLHTPAEPNEMDKDVTHPRMLYALRSRKEKPHPNSLASSAAAKAERESDKWKIRVLRRLLLCAEKLICSSETRRSEREI